MRGTGRTLAIMVTMTAYGTWLRGDRRGWVDDGFIMPPDPMLQSRDAHCMKHPPFRFDPRRLCNVGDMIGRSLTDRLHVTVLALTVQTWHAHIVIAATHHDIGTVVKCAKDAARYGLRPGRPIWTDGYDKRFCFDMAAVRGRIRYVEKHNEALGLHTRPWPFITTFDEWLAHI